MENKQEIKLERISHFAVLVEAPVNSSHERIFEVTAKLQQEVDQQVVDKLQAEHDEFAKDRQQVINGLYRIIKEQEAEVSRLEAEKKEMIEELENVVFPNFTKAKWENFKAKYLSSQKE